MKRLDEFSEEARKAQLHLQIDSDKLDQALLFGTDGVFHVPLLALCILIIARSKKVDLWTADLAAWTGATLGRHFAGSPGTQRKLEWSLQHRKRCADALVFLENVQLVSVQETPQRTVRCTARGLEFVRTILRRTDEVGVLLRGLDRSHREVEHHGFDLL